MAEPSMAELIAQSWLLLSSPREHCPVPSCGCQLAGTRRGGQLLSSHPQWNLVTVGVGGGGGSESSDSRQLVICAP